MKIRARARLLCLVGIGILYAISVPWYRDAHAPLRIWLGLPDWVAVALLCYVGVAILNALAWLWAEVSDGSDVSEASEGYDDPGARQ